MQEVIEATSKDETCKDRIQNERSERLRLKFWETASVSLGLPGLVVITL
jgi:hypothetical protein